MTSDIEQCKLAACGRGGKLHLWRAPSWAEIEAEEKKLESKQSP